MGSARGAGQCSKEQDHKMNIFEVRTRYNSGGGAIGIRGRQYQAVSTESGGTGASRLIYGVSTLHNPLRQMLLASN